MKPTLRIRPGGKMPDPQELLEVAVGGLDDLWEAMVSAEMSRVKTRAEAEKRIGERWRREDRLHLRHKLEFWKAFDRARSHAG